MFIPGGCYCCEPPEDPCVLSGCTWSSTDMSDTDLTAGVTYHNAVSGATPDGNYEVTNTQDSATGNSLPCRSITIETAIAPAVAETVYAICWKDNATHTPSAQCPLTNVSFCVESKRGDDSDGGLTDGVVFVVRQGGKIYATATQSVGVNWKRASGTYTANQFTWVNGSGNPNFTATGTAIEFGFALKLSVPKDGEPYDVVLFDNLCITRTECGGCNTSGCDTLNTGTSALSLLFTDTAGGEFTVSYGLSSGVGISPPSHKYTFARGGTSSNFAFASTRLATSLPSSCRSITEISICNDLRGEGDGTANQINGSVWYGIFQSGFAYFRINDSASVAPANNLSVTRGAWTSPSTLIVASGTVWWKKCSGTFATGVSTQSGPDLSQPFDIVLMVRSGSINLVTTSEVYIDNICVKATYSSGCATGVSYSVSVSGLSVIEKTPSCGAAFSTAATELSAILASTMILTYNPVSSSQSLCVWTFSQATPSDSVYKMSVSLAHRKDGTGGWSLGFTTNAMSSVISASSSPYGCDNTLAFTGLDPYFHPSGWNPISSCLMFNPTALSATVTPL